MKFEVTTDFEKSLKRLSKKYQSLKSDYLNFLDELEKNPFLGDEIIAGCRKVRIAIKSKGKGKSGGARIIFYYEIVNNKVILLFVYDKNKNLQSGIYIVTCTQKNNKVVKRFIK